MLQYVDLDEFLSENGMPGEGLGGAALGGAPFAPLGLPAPAPPVPKRERSPSPSDCMSPDTINPPLSPADSSECSPVPPVPSPPGPPGRPEPAPLTRVRAPCFSVLDGVVGARLRPPHARLLRRGAEAAADDQEVPETGK